MCASDGTFGRALDGTPSRVWRSTFAALLIVAVSTVQAQSNTREQEQLRRLRQQVQQLQQDQAAQQTAVARAGTEKAALKTQLDAAQAELKRARGQASSQAQDAQGLQKEIDAARVERTALQARLDQLQTEFQDGTRNLAQARTDGGELKRKLGFRETQLAELADRHVRQAQGLQQCIDNNKALRDLGAELMQRYADKGIAEVMAHKEPFLQTRRVALENLLQGYQDKLDLLALKAAAATSGAAQTAPAAEPARAP